MTIVKFEFQGPQELLVPDTLLCVGCAKDVIEGRSYQLPGGDQSHVKCVVDVGAHTGEFTVMAALRWPEAVIYALEPNPNILPFLQHNCRKFPNVRIIEKALAVKGGRQKLFFSRLGSVAYSLIPGRSDHGEATQGVEVAVMGWPELAELKPDVLKLDVEGVETELFQAFSHSFLRATERIYVEFHDEATRLLIDARLSPTHALDYARITKREQGEVMYARRDCEAAHT